VNVILNRVRQPNPSFIVRHTSSNLDQSLSFRAEENSLVVENPSLEILNLELVRLDTCSGSDFVHSYDLSNSESFVIEKSCLSIILFSFA
jgi:hypothetical protein